MAKKKDLTKLAMSGAMAFGGGVGGELVADLVAKQAPDWVAENPKLAEGVPAAAGLLGLYLAPEKFSPVFYGMIGAAGAGLADDIIPMEGFSRTRGMNGTEADEYASGLDYVESLQKKAFEEVEDDVPPAGM